MITKQGIKLMAIGAVTVFFAAILYGLYMNHKERAAYYAPIQIGVDRNG